MTRKISNAWNVGLVLLAMIAAGCGPRGRMVVPEGSLAGSVCILQPAYSNRMAQLALEQLSDVFPRAPVFPLERSEEWLARCLAEKKVLVVPDARHVPVEFWAPLRRYLDAGGAAVLWGRDPFGARVQRMGRDVATEHEVRQRWPAYAEHIAGVSGIAAWQHVGDEGRPGGPVRLARDAALPWPGVTVQIPAFVAQDGMVLADIPKAAIPSRLNTMIFYARGDAGLAHLAVECETVNGERWHHVIPVTEQWQPFFLRQESFHREGEGGGAPQFSMVRKLTIGLSDALAPQAPGAYGFGLSEVRFIYDGRPVQEAVGWPDMPTVSPPSRRYDLTAATIEMVYSGERVAVDGWPLQSPLPRATGAGGESGATYRWIPLARALDQDGACLGWPASMYIEPGDDGRLRQWAWIGMDPGADNKALLQRLLRLCVWRLKSGHFLYKAGCGAFALRSGERIRLTARWLSGWGDAAPVRLAAELLDERGAVVRRVVSPSLLNASADGEAVEVALGVAPTIRSAARNMTLRMSLVDREDQRMLDYVEQPVKVLPLTDRVPEEEGWIAATGSRLTLTRRPLFLLGTAYQPMNTTSLQPGEGAAHWLDPAVFDPVVIRRDLDRLAEGGINILWVRYDDEAHAPQLRFLADEARARRMWIGLRVPHLQPFDFDWPRATNLFAAAGLSTQPRIFALDLGEPMRPTNAAAEDALNEAWRKWLVEQFGALDRAERLIAQPLWRKKGKMVGPAAVELAANDGQDARMAVYRRFADDLVSRHYGAVRRLLRQAGFRQLISRRVATEVGQHALPVEPASGAVHLDFLVLDGSRFRGRPGDAADAAFWTLYARGASGGKPVVWADMGVPVGSDPRPEDLANQSRVIAEFLDMAFRSQAGGCIARWYPAGLREDGVDAGLVNADATWRPAGERFRDLSHRLRRERMTPAPWRGRTLERGLSAKGLTALSEAWRDIMWNEIRSGQMEEVRPLGFGKESRVLDVEAVGGVRHEDPAPMALLNAEWGGVQIEGVDQPERIGAQLRMEPKQRIRLELINTGPATWSASDARRTKTVWLRVLDPQGRSMNLEVKTVAYGDRTWINWTASEPGLWRFQPLLSDAGMFGEPLFISVAAPR